VLLDPKTTLAYYVLTSLTLAALLIVAFRGRFTPALRLWLTSLLLQSAGWCFISLQQLPHPWLTTAVGPVLVSTSFSFIVEAVMRFYGQPSKHYWPFWPIPCAVAAVLLWHDVPATRQIALNLCYAFQLTAGALFLLKRKDPHRGLRWLMAGSSFFACVLLFIRVAYLIGNQDDVPALLIASPFQSLTFSVGFVLRLVFTCGFLLLIEAHRNDELTWLAAMDSLTGIYNRRTFINLAETELARSQRHQQPLALLLLDLDHFKLINDTLGHQAGDCILQQLRTIAEPCMRSHDFMGRYGGEEFCILAPETDADGAFILAERLRQALAEHVTLSGNGASIKITASIGVACRTGRESTTLDELLSMADTALYRAKNEGRNRVTLA
jgi:diguanylate cyclase (GGDEF)-like protein